MSTLARTGAFVLGLAAVFALALGVGRLADPDVTPVVEHDAGHGTGHDAGQGTGHGDVHAGHETGTPADVHLALGRRTFAPGPSVKVSFTIADAAGNPVKAFDTKHEKQLHLIVLDTRALTDFHHVHPRRSADGRWSARLPLAPGTSYRLYADGSTRGQDFVATADIVTTGSSAWSGRVPPRSTRDEVDGLRVKLGYVDSAVRFTVTRDGRPVGLEPYLGALGHLVVIRVDDLSYQHVHPVDGAAGAVFEVSGLAAGDYRYFFDFKAGGQVHTASYTVPIAQLFGGGR